jgi:Galactose oxidase, central domain
MGACLVVGGERDGFISATAELVDPHSGSSSLKQTTATRRGHTATLLQPPQSIAVSSGPARVLIAGGGDNAVVSAPQSSAEVYDAGTNSFSPTAGPMSVARHAHTAALLGNGAVLIAGGFGPNGLESSADLYDDGSRTFSATGPMTTPRWGHTATTLVDGRVLIAGGEHLKAGPLDSAELYDPAKGTFTFLGKMNRARWQHTATILKNGRVLLVGGVLENTAEVFDPTTGTFTATGSMAAEYSGHGAVLLDDGRVLIVGTSSGGGVIRSGEVYDPVTGTFQATTGGFSSGQHATRIDDNRVYAVGDELVDPRGYLFDPRTNAFAPLPTQLVHARDSFCTVTYLPSPRVTHYAQIDPLVLLLSAHVYLDLHAPDPAPIIVLEARIRAAIAGLNPEQRQQLRQRVRAFGQLAERIERELGSL